ncbi:hypothetical protein ACFPVX_10355 [Cohnella faecalis]|uniref:Uncharacterized protein n=1 Tax=Cohnella faecalis TaxID=2315694 RepID=A0A398CMU1_9BACL|nr:hypothetical protein [Cohnella faecalis]RIE03560.1 hypothetical protein D3H35_11010 [Cohnella faecalis]
MLIFLEGLPGVGKSTNTGLLYRQFERNGFATSWVHEFDRPHPVLFFHEACLKKDEYRSWKHRHGGELTVLDEMVRFRDVTVGIDLLELEWNYSDRVSETAFAELREKDVWNFSLEEYMDVALEKWRSFAEKLAEKPEQVVLLDSCIFQYQIFSFQLENAPAEELNRFVQALWDIVSPLQPRLVYLYRNSVADAIDHLRAARGARFFRHIWERDRSRPYYKARADSVETYFEFLNDYNRTAQELFEKAPCPKLGIEVTAGDWKEYERRLLAFFDLTPISDLQEEFEGGEFFNDALGISLQIKQVEGAWLLTDPEGNERQLHPRSSKEFYIRDLPVLLDTSVKNQIVISGASLNNRWTETGLVFAKNRDWKPRGQ